MFQSGRFRLIRFSALLLASMLLFSCDTSRGYHKYINIMLKGNSTTSDFLDGKINVETVAYDESEIAIMFSNKQILTLIPASGRKNKFQQGKESTVTAFYRGHQWKKTFTVKIEEICLDDLKNIHYVRFSTNIILEDCEKQILNFNCQNLQAQYDVVPLSMRYYQRGEVSGIWSDDNAFTVVAKGEPKKEITELAARKESAKKAAILNAKLKIIEIFSGEKIKNPSEITDIKKTGIEFSQALYDIVENGYVIEGSTFNPETKYNQDGECQITFRVRANDLRKRVQLGEFKLKKNPK